MGLLSLGVIYDFLCSLDIFEIFPVVEAGMYVTTWYKQRATVFAEQRKFLRRCTSLALLRQLHGNEAVS